MDILDELVGKTAPDSNLPPFDVKVPEGMTPEDEAKFQVWYGGWSKKLGLNPNPDDPQHFYDYRAAWKAGAEPTAESGWHWPSTFKREGHPRMVVDGVNTKTGKPTDPVEDLLSEAKAVPSDTAPVKSTSWLDLLSNIGTGFQEEAKGRAAGSRAAASVAGSLAAMPVGGVVALRDIANKGVVQANKDLQTITSIPGKILQSPEEEQVASTANVVTVPFTMAGKGLAGAMELRNLVKEAVHTAINKRQKVAEEDIDRAFAEATKVIEGKSGGSSVSVPIAGTIGEAAAVFGLPGVPKSVKSRLAPIWYRMTVPERQLAILTLDDMLKTGMSEGEILRKFQNPNWFAEAQAKRAKTEGSTTGASAEPPVEEFKPTQRPSDYGREEITLNRNLETGGAQLSPTGPVKDILDEIIADSQKMATKSIIHEPAYTGEQGPADLSPKPEPPTLTKQGKPFTSEVRAERSALNAGLAADSFEIVDVDGGFGYRKIQKTTKPVVPPPSAEPAQSPVEVVKSTVSKIDEVPATTDYEAEAKRLGVVFNGLQDRVGGKPPIPLFTDPELKTTFALQEGESLEQAIQRKRDQAKAYEAPVEEKLFPAVKVDGEVFVAKTPDETLHSMVYDNIPEGKILGAETVESGWAKADGSGWTKKPKSKPTAESVTKQGRNFDVKDITLQDMKERFPGQEVIQPGGVNSPIYIKTKGNDYWSIETVKHISPEETLFEVQHGRKFDPKTDEIVGDQLEGRIRLVKNKSGLWTADHESFHRIEEALLTKSEVKLFSDHVKKEIKEGRFEEAPYREVGGSEDRADYYADFRNTPEAKQPWFVKKILNKIKEFIDKLANAFGVRTVKGILRDIKSGKIYSREGKAEGFTEGSKPVYAKKKQAKPQEFNEEGEPIIKHRLIKASKKTKYLKQIEVYQELLDKAKAEISELTGIRGKVRFDELKNERIEKFYDAISKLKTDEAAYRKQGYQRAIEMLKKREYNSHVAKLKSTVRRLERMIERRKVKAAETKDTVDSRGPAILEKDFRRLKALPDMRGKVLGKEFNKSGKPIGGWFENPIYAFEEWGRAIGPKASEWVKKHFYYPIVDATHKANVRFTEVYNEAEKLRKGLPKDAGKNIYIYALSKEFGGPEILKEMGIKEIPKLSTQELAAYKWFRGEFKKFFDEVNKGRIAGGLPPFQEVQNYFTFGRDLSLSEQLGFGFDDTLLKDYIHPRGPDFPYAERRVDKGGLKKVHLDAFTVFEQYAQTATRHMYLLPAIAKIREMTGSFIYRDAAGKLQKWSMKDQQPNAYKMITDYTDYVSGKKKVQLPSEVEAVMDLLARNITTATLSMSARSAIIQPTSLLNTYIEIGPKYLVKGLAGLATDQRPAAMKKSKVLLNREFDIHVEQATTGALGKIAAVREAWNKSWLGMKPLKILDMESATATWIGAFEKGKEVDGLTEEQAIRYADDTVTKTQGSAARHDRAPVQRTAIGRWLTTFQTFVIGNWNFFLREALGAKNTGISFSKALHKVFRLALGATLINSIFEDLMGINSPLPAPISGASKEYARSEDLGKALTAAGLEFLQFMPGTGGLRYGSGLLGAPVDYLADVARKLAEASGRTNIYYEGSETKKLRGLKTSSSGPYKQTTTTTRPGLELLGKGLGVPGTAQAVKTYRILQKGGSIPEAIVGKYPDNKKNALRSLRGLD